MEQIFTVAFLWLALAVLSTLIVYHLRVSVALIEIGGSASPLCSVYSDYKTFSCRMRIGSASWPPSGQSSSRFWRVQSSTRWHFDQNSPKSVWWEW